MYLTSAWRRERLRRSIVASLLAISITAVAWAADHREAPLTSADTAADIADVYAWHDAGANKLTTIITFAGLAAPTRHRRGTFDSDVVYVLNIDNDGDFAPDIEIKTRFLQNRRGRWLVLVEDLPGSRPTVVGRVNKKIRAQGNRIFAGLRDDPFFFDFEGFLETLATGTLSFDSTRDSFAGTNATAIVLEMDLAAALGSGSTLNIWATTAR